jgi:hypothetical protein
LVAIRSYYRDVPARRRKAKGLVLGADHNDIQGQPDCQFLSIGCRNGVEGFLPYVTAWLAWQLGVEPTARGVFVGHNASFQADPRLSGIEVD